MHVYSLVAAVPLALALAVPAPAPVAAPVAAPAPFPVPIAAPKVQSGDVKVAGLLGGLIQGARALDDFMDAVPAVFKDAADSSNAANQVTDAIANGTVTGDDAPAIVRMLFRSSKPTSTPASIPDAIKQAADFQGISDPNTAPSGQNLLSNGLGLILKGFTSPEVAALAQGSDPLASSYKNVNPPVPAGKEFYNKVQGDAPFSVSEEKLRAAISIPPGFTKGAKQPVVMSPGTGATGTINFSSNIGKLLAQGNDGDPVFLNIPDALLGDAQISAEFVSYGIQYTQAITNRNPAVVTWSQGSLNAQWAFKYWPSTRAMVTDHIAISPDYRGTVLARLLCPGFALGNKLACTPAISQQVFDSDFVKTLRSDDGDSAYVPTTTVYSGTDEIVQPQQGTMASGFIKDARGVGASNTFLQGACPGQPAGGLYTHEGVLYNSVAYALVIDALQNDGPGSFERVKAECQNVVATGLTLADVLATEALIPLALLNILKFQPKVNDEPAIKSYALAG